MSSYYRPYFIIRLTPSVCDFRIYTTRDLRKIKTNNLPLKYFIEILFESFRIINVNKINCYCIDKSKIVIFYIYDRFYLSANFTFYTRSIQYIFLLYYENILIFNNRIFNIFLANKKYRNINANDNLSNVMDKMMRWKIRPNISLIKIVVISTIVYLSTCMKKKVEMKEKNNEMNSKASTIPSKRWEQRC